MKGASGVAMSIMVKSWGHFYSAHERNLAAYGHFMLNFMNLEAFYRTAIKSVDLATPEMQKEWQEGMQECMTSPEMQRCIQESSIPRKDDFVKRLSLGLADRSVRLAKRTVDSAALVFAHTLLDEALSEACRISFQADPR